MRRYLTLVTARMISVKEFIDETIDIVSIAPCPEYRVRTSAFYSLLFQLQAVYEVHRYIWMMINNTPWPSLCTRRNSQLQTFLLAQGTQDFVNSLACDIHVQLLQCRSVCLTCSFPPLFDR